MDYMTTALEKVHNMHNYRICFIGVEYGKHSLYEKISINEKYDVWKLVIQPNSFTGGLFSNEQDNYNYISIIKTYEIDENRITKQQIDNYEL